ncbi:phytanoyl-CoA dioxygenase family protein [Sphingomonas sp. QA11]|uniref:phytanoyl-CoA dioxygenase family protein n=1 Tax=Sphingomonas sp. QA11 TaxID=2950605 RepID=UPI00234B3EFC|nr:phytanoyl-CoA dioxygenase family protein [Sphingomonas sp. QA11]WCM27780.1 phytanoyl-CoA dioxygenase family protein [Sphingomonas sp. QA11]
MTASSAALASAPDHLPHIRGLEDYWARCTFRSQAEANRETQSRPLLDVLGLGLEQTLKYLGAEQPDLPTFQAWVLETAGEPDPLKVARYHAWLDGAPPPDGIAQRLRAIDEAPPVLDREDLAHWDEHGFVILRQAITPDQARAAEELLWRQVNATPDDPQSWYERRPNGIMVQHFQDSAMEAARQSPRVHKAFAQLWGTADLWMITDRLSFNPPERPGFTFPGPNLHFDMSLALPIPFATQGILYLTETTGDQGALQLVPGFHHGIEDWLGSVGDGDPRTIDLSDRAVPIAAGAGDLILWRQDLPHGASPNRAARPRMAQYVNMYPADLTSNPVWR